MVRFLVDIGSPPTIEFRYVQRNKRLPQNFLLSIKNISKKTVSTEKQPEAEKLVEVKENIENKFDYPFNSLSWHEGDEYYPELDAAVEFYNQKRYKTALDLFETRPADPARGFKILFTFHGPIGWLLMANTKAAKDKFLNFCIANCYYKLGEYSKALKSLKSDDSERALYLRAWCEYKLHQNTTKPRKFQEGILFELGI